MQPLQPEQFQGKMLRFYIGNDQYVQGVFLGRSDNCYLLLSKSKTMGNMMTFVPINKISRITSVTGINQHEATPQQHVYSSLN